MYWSKKKKPYLENTKAWLALVPGYDNAKRLNVQPNGPMTGKGWLARRGRARLFGDEY